MPIPNLTGDGLLPTGEYVCTVEEICEVFGQMPDYEYRSLLCKQLKKFVEAVSAMDIASDVVVDGSFTTSRKEKPSDIDVVLNLITEESANVMDIKITQTRGRQHWLGYPKIHTYGGFKGTPSYDNYVDFFQMLEGSPEKRKGYLKVIL